MILNPWSYEKLMRQCSTKQLLLIMVHSWHSIDSSEYYVFFPSQREKVWYIKECLIKSCCESKSKNLELVIYTLVSSLLRDQ